MVRSKFKDQIHGEVDYVRKFTQHAGGKRENSPKGKRRMESIQKLMHTIENMDSNSRRRNFHIDKGMFVERLKQDHMFEVVDELKTISDQKI